MHRIQIQLTPDQERILREMARLRGSSISALVREGIDEFIGPEKERRDRARRAALALVGAFADDAPDVSQRHDDYLAEATEASVGDERG